MTSREQNIKNWATAIAIVLAIIITGLICFGVYSFLSFFSDDSEHNSIGKTFNQSYKNASLTELSVDTSVGQLIINSGEELTVSGTNVLDDFSCEYNDGILDIKNSSKKTINLSGQNKCVITVTIPTDTVLETFYLKTGAGNTTICNLLSDSVTIEAGAGNITFEDSVFNNTSIICGVGNFTISNSSLSGNTNLECGVGKLLLSDSELTGSCNVECGLGDFTLSLNGNLEDYEIDISAALGQINLNGQTYDSISKLNKGAPNALTIDGGVGTITINID